MDLFAFYVGNREHFVYLIRYLLFQLEGIKTIIFYDLLNIE